MFKTREKKQLKIGSLVRYIEEEFSIRNFLNKNLSPENKVSDEMLNIGLVTKLIKIRTLRNKSSEYAVVYWIVEKSTTSHMVVNLELLS